MSEAVKKHVLPSFNDTVSSAWNGCINNQTVIWKIVGPYVALTIVSAIAQYTYQNIPVLTALTAATSFAMYIASIALTKLMNQIIVNKKVDKTALTIDLFDIPWPYLGVSIVVGLIVGLGFLALIVPGIILAIMYYGAPYAAILDRKGVGESMKYSVDITRGHKSEMFVLFLTIGVVVGLIYFISIGILSFLLSIVGALISESWALALPGVGQAILMGFMMPFSTGIGVVIYDSLKKAHKSK